MDTLRTEQDYQNAMANLERVFTAASPGTRGLGSNGSYGALTLARMIVKRTV